MHVLIEMSPWLIAMAVLIACSAFFSGSEAALFYLRWDDRRTLSVGGPSQRAAARLLKNPDRLLSAVLLWNLAINAYEAGENVLVFTGTMDYTANIRAVSWFARQVFPRVRAVVPGKCTGCL